MPNRRRFIFSVKFFHQALPLISYYRFLYSFVATRHRGESNIGFTQKKSSFQESPFLLVASFLQTGGGNVRHHKIIFFDFLEGKVIFSITMVCYTFLVLFWLLRKVALK